MENGTPKSATDNSFDRADPAKIGVLVGTFSLVASLPVIAMAVAYVVLVTFGVGSGRALSIAGLGGVSVAGLWGILVALLKIDTKLFGRR